MNLIFTKLGTVKCDEFELTKEVFFRKMTNLIIDNCDLHNVSYDENNDTYEVMFNSNKYIVKYGNEILTSKCSNQSLVSCLNQLVSISKLQRTLKDEQDEIERAKKEKREKVMENAKNNILITNEEKLAKIELLKEENKKNKIDVMDETLETLHDINVGDHNAFLAILRLGTLVVGAGALFLGGVILLAGGLAALSQIPLIIYIGTVLASIDGICFIVAFNNINRNNYRGLYATAFSIVAAPFILGYYSVKKFAEIRRLKHQIKKIERSIINNTNPQNNKVKNRSLDVINDMLNNTNNKSSDANDLLMSIKEFDELKNSILQIKDESIKNEYATELFKLLNCCVNLTKIKTNRNKLYSMLLSELSKLKIKVNNKLKEEENIKNGHYKLMSELNNNIKEAKNEARNEEYAPQKKIGAR